MKTFCFGNMSENSVHSPCGLLKCKEELPYIEIENKNMRIVFSKRVIAKTFSGYYGAIQDYLARNEICSVEIDFRNTEYINMFCISKIVLTIMDNPHGIRYTFFWPSLEKKESFKLLRYLYNKGILKILFEKEMTSHIVEGNYITDYKMLGDFSGCIDSAIFPYKVYKVEKRNNKYYRKEEVIKVVDEVMNDVKTYFQNRQENSYENIKNRLYLYLYEIIENIYVHAYRKCGYFGILISYDYLPRYLWDKNNLSKEKYKQRVHRLERENPLSLYGDIEDRYIGGISLWIDDIGEGIAQTVKGGYYQQMYRDTYLNGLNEEYRASGKTRLNGLKLIGDEIANNGDYLWIHDCWHWVGTHCNELKSNIVKEDESRKEGGNAYEHPFVKGCSYEIRVNLARNSKGKRNSFINFGVPFNISFDELRDNCKRAIEDNQLLKSALLIDLFNSDNHTKRTEDYFLHSCESMIYRSRAIRKEQFKGELFERLFLKMPENYQFEELVIYDLSQTALFQVRALIETEEYSKKLIKHGVKRVVLISTEFYVFVMEIENYLFKSRKQYSEDYVGAKKEKLLYYFRCIQENDNKMVNAIISKNKKNMMISADIQWGNIWISKYLDMEAVLNDRQIFTILRKMLIRVNGLLASESRFSFIEDFLENNFAEYLNEFSSTKAPKVYIGSLLLTKQTERKRVMAEDEKIYLFLHDEAELIDTDKYIFLLRFPEIKLRKQKCKYRRIKATHRIEKYMNESEEFLFYKSDVYKNMISTLDYQIGIYSSGAIAVVENEKLRDIFKKFIVEQLSICVKKYEHVEFKIDDNLAELCGNAEMYIAEIKESIVAKGRTRILEKKFMDNSSDSSVVIYITKSIELLKLLELNSMQESCVVISLFNEIAISEGFDKLISIGYMPFIPIFHKNIEIIREDDLKTFKASVATLVPTLRREVEKIFTQTQGSYNFDFLTELKRYFNKQEAYSILCDAIEYYITYSTNGAFEMRQDGDEYNLLLLVMLWQEQKVRVNYNRDERLLENILSQLEYQRDKKASILTYYCMLILYLFQASLSVKVIEAHKENIKNIFLYSNNPFIKIIYANILEQWNTMDFRIELNEIFVGNDISLYYQRLYQNLFNDFGEDHDSILYKYCKSKPLTDEERKNLSPIVNDCITLLKLTKPYYEEKEKIVDLEVSLKEQLELKTFKFEFRQKCQLLKQYVTDRFVVIRTSDLRHDLKEFVIGRIVKGAREKQADLKLTDDMQDYIICSNDKPLGMKKLIFPNDSYVIDEIVYLFLDAIKNSKNVKITSESNQEKENEVWIKCYVKDGYINIIFYNYLGEEYDDVMEKIKNKKRVGKTHLEKFNISVSYEENPVGMSVIAENNHIIATHILIPYFS